MAPIPTYAPLLAAYHRANGAELQRIVEELPLAANSRMLDVACGDGTYSRWFSNRLASDGLVVGMDVSRPYLRAASSVCSTTPPPLFFVEADASRLPFLDGSFDLVWCAQSLISLPDVPRAIREMCRVTRQNGTVAILEQDPMHHVLLPWPPGLELSLQRAELEFLSDRHGPPEQCYAARTLLPLLQEAGLTGCVSKTYVTDRQAPLTGPEKEFLELHFSDLRHRLGPYLEPSERRELAALSRPTLSTYLPSSPGFSMTFLDVVCTGRRE